jgi:valyl-tRNA synthetase
MNNKRKEMDKRFEPASYEARWQEWWTDNGFFEAEAPSERPSFCIMIPPPNVTGSLHVGHALQATIQDLLIRWKRMSGYNALWLPGTDHAGIATQLMVERQLVKEGLDRKTLGREAFLERAWEWTEQHSGNIRWQHDKLGASCDWSRERFTLDEGLSRAVREAFVRQYREGLITRAEYIVNWSPGLETAISDLEVEMKTVQGKLYHIAYPIDGSEERIVVATTRPETMLGDTAIAIHPEDERLGELESRFAVLPLVGRKLPFVADEVVDREFGTGMVKVTPFHDPADFDIGKRHDLPGIQVIDRKGRMTAETWSRSSPIPTMSVTVSGAEYRSSRWFPRSGSATSRSRRSGHCKRSRRAICNSFPIPGARPGSTGWTTSSPGASPVSSGGVIRFLPGTRRTVNASSRTTWKRRSKRPVPRI